MTLAISIQSLRKTYPRNWAAPPFEALKGISLSIEPGEVFGFIGQNGAGKSTAIKVLIGAIRATSGSASLFGVDVGDPVARKGLGYVPENPNLPDYLTPMEVLGMGLAMNRCNVSDPRKHSMHWLDRFGLADAANKVIKGFSKGMAQRTVLAHAMVAKPRLLILDEPLSGLDPIGRRDVVDILSEYRQQGGTIFLTSHVLHDVERLADRFGLIHKGELKAVRSPSELVSDDERVLVRTRGTDPVVSGMASESGGRWVVEVSRLQLWPLLESINAAGHTLLEIRPALSLEAAFLEVVGTKSR